MKNILTILASSVIVLSGVVLILALSHVYLPGQKVNGKDVTFKSVEHVYNDYLSTIPDVVTVIINEKTITIPINNCVEVLPYDHFDTVFGGGWLTRKEILYNTPRVINSKMIADELEKHYAESKDAYIELVGDKWLLHDEVIGNSFDITQATNFIVDAINLGTYSDIVIETNSKPITTTTDLVKSYDSVSWLNDYNLSYVDGTSILGSTLSSYVHDYELVVPEDFYTNILSVLHEQFDTTSSILEYQTYNGEMVSVPYKTYGVSVNDTEELKFIEDSITNRLSYSQRNPVMKGYDNISGCYVEISIEDQHLWYLKDGELLTETAIVTGRLNRNDTPTGVYYITECIPGKYLIGADYKTWVNRWMRLTDSGIGLHDATWRSKFGGNIYTYDGSHGCINLPKNFAYEFYKEAYVGMPVIIY